MNKILNFFAFIVKKIFQGIMRLIANLLFILMSFVIMKILNVILLVGLALYALHYFGIAPSFVNGIISDIKNQIGSFTSSF